MSFVVDMRFWATGVCWLLEELLNFLRTPLESIMEYTLRGTVIALSMSPRAVLLQTPRTWALSLVN
jgi:hypothetical protein